MSYLAGVIVVFLFFVVLNNFTELDKKQKIIVGFAAMLIVAGAIAFNEYSDSQREHIMKMELSFVQNRTVVCDGIEVNQSNFSYSEGTQVFIGKKDTPYYGKIISITQCQ